MKWLVTSLLCLVVVLTRTTLAGVPHCKTVFSEECWDEPKTVCDYVKKPVVSLA
jgi:hypothetical protein